MGRDILNILVDKLVGYTKSDEICWKYEIDKHRFCADYRGTNYTVTERHYDIHGVYRPSTLSVQFKKICTTPGKLYKVIVGQSERNNNAVILGVLKRALKTLDIDIND